MSEGSLAVFVALFSSLFIGLLTVWATLIAGSSKKPPRWILPVALISVVGLVYFGFQLFVRSTNPPAQTSATSSSRTEIAGQIIPSAEIAETPLGDVLPSAINPASTVEPSATIDNSNTLVVDQRLQTTVPNFEATLKSIDFLPSGGMRWNFEFWNRTSQDQRVSISRRDSYVVDDLGTRYPLTSVFDETIQPGVKIQGSLTFDQVNVGAGIFELYLLTISSSFVNFQQPAIIVNK